MPLPAILIAPLATGAPWIARVLVRWAWSPLIVGLGVLLKTRLGLIILQAFFFLGLTFSTLKVVVGPAIAALEAYTTGVNSGTGEFVQAAFSYLGILRMDQAVTMVISAVVTRNAVSAGRLFLMRRGV